MKNSIKTFLLLFVLSTVFASAAFAANKPIPGVDIIVRKKPGGNIVATTPTDKSGKVSMQLAEGDYEVSIPYSQIEKAMSAQKASTTDNQISFTLYSKGVTGPDTSKPIKAVLDKTTGTLTFTIPAGGATIIGELVFAPSSSSTHQTRSLINISRSNIKHKTDAK